MADIPFANDPAAGGGGADRGSRRLAGAGAVLRRLARWAWFVEDELLGLSMVVGRGAVCLDVGAEFGVYTGALADLVGPRGAVHSFEPLAGPTRTLVAGVRALGCRNVWHHQVALGASEGHGAMSLPWRRGLPVHGRAFLTTGARGVGPNREFATSSPVAVEVTTIDAVCDRAAIERVDFIKADVEGAELAVLQGAVATLTAHRPALLLEIEARHLAKYGTHPADLVGWLTDRGYLMHTWNGGTWTKADAVTDEHRNYLFVTGDRAVSE